MNLSLEAQGVSPSGEHAIVLAGHPQSGGFPWAERVNSFSSIKEDAAQPPKGHLTSLRFYTRTHTHMHIPSIHISLCTSQGHSTSLHIHTHTRTLYINLQRSLNKSMPSRTYSHPHTLYIHNILLPPHLPRITKQIYAFAHALYTHNILLPLYLKGQLAVYASAHTHTHSLITRVPSTHIALSFMGMDSMMSHQFSFIMYILQTC